MSEEIIETKSGLAGQPKPMKKKVKWWQIVIDVVLISAFIVVSCIAIDVIYLSTAFSESFFVNGMSMYPTLNSTALRKTDSGYRALTWADSSNIAGDIVDYGYAKTGDKDNWRASLKRYDIVIAYYKDDFVDPYAEKPVLKDNVSPKIKRLIGLPGETVDFSVVTVNDETGNTAWGKTLINGEPLKPLYGPSDFPAVNGRSYDKVTSPTYGHVVLGQNEYYVIGDNRGGYHSDDSRQRGPLRGEWIYGKACLIVSKRNLEKNGTTFNAKFNLWQIRMPWNYQGLE